MLSTPACCFVAYMPVAALHTTMLLHLHSYTMRTAPWAMHTTMLHKRSPPPTQPTTNTHTSPQQFNPILGETWQASLPDGTRIYLEQVSHHPPVSAFEMVGPGDLFTFSGLSQPEVQAKLQSNAIKTTAKGYRCVTFRDGGAIQIVYPTYMLRGAAVACMRAP